MAAAPGAFTLLLLSVFIFQEGTAMGPLSQPCAQARASCSVLRPPVCGSDCRPEPLCIETAWLLHVPGLTRDPSGATPLCLRDSRPCSLPVGPVPFLLLSTHCVSF